MKRSMKLIPMAFLVLLPFSSFAGGNSGGGGGGICLQNNKCITLAQAGLRIKEMTEERNSLLTDELLAELDRVITLLPGELRISADQVIGRKSDIREVQIDNQRKLKSFIKEYQQILKENGDAKLAKDVELMAFTSPLDYNSKVTYLIREKFEALNVRGQVLILLHEFLLREKKFSLKDALIFDGVVVDYLAAAEANKRPDATGIIKVIEKLRNGEGIERTRINSYSLNEAIIGKPLDVRDFDIRQSGNFSYLIFSYNQILRLSKSYPKMKFVKDSLDTSLVNRTRMDYLNTFVEFLVKDISKLSKVVLNKEYFEAFLTYYKIDSTSFNVCESYSDQSSWIVANESDAIVNLPYKINCALEPAAVNESGYRLGYRVYADTFETIFKNIDGFNVNFEENLTCQFRGDRKGTSFPEVICK